MGPFMVRCDQLDCRSLLLILLSVAHALAVSGRPAPALADVYDFLLYHGLRLLSCSAPLSPVRCSVWLAIVFVHISNSSDWERPGSKRTLKRGFGTFPEVYRLRKDVWSKSLPCYILSPSQL